MRIGELAQSAAVTVDTIRYYERIGVIPKARRTANGYRDYAPEVRDRLRVIRNAVHLGFPLKEITKLLRIRDAGGAPCAQVRDYAVTLVEQINRRIAEMKTERKAMLALIAQWNIKLSKTKPGSRAHLLDQPLDSGVGSSL
jgi:MerR family copper efflux transcriptional regulator